MKKHLSTKKIKRYLTVLCITLLLATTAYSAPAWYRGKVTRVWYYGNNAFIVTLDSGALDDCRHHYAYFRESTMGSAVKLNQSFSVALAAMLSGKSFGVVIDKSINGPGGYCYVTNADIK